MCVQGTGCGTASRCTSLGHAVCRNWCRDVIAGQGNIRRRPTVSSCHDRRAVAVSARLALLPLVSRTAGDRDRVETRQGDVARETARIRPSRVLGTTVPSSGCAWLVLRSRNGDARVGLLLVGGSPVGCLAASARPKHNDVASHYWPGTGSRLCAASVWLPRWSKKPAREATSRDKYHAIDQSVSAPPLHSLARIIHEEADYSRKTNAPVWYNGCAHRPFATTEALA